MQECRNSMNPEMNTPQKSCIMYQLHKATIRSIIVQENSQKIIKTCNPIEILAHMLFIRCKVWKFHKTMKTYQETYGNFFGIFCEKINMRRGSDSKERGVYSTRNSRKCEKHQDPRVKGPKPKYTDGSGSPERPWGVGLIRIQQT